MNFHIILISFYIQCGCFEIIYHKQETLLQSLKMNIVFLHKVQISLNSPKIIIYLNLIDEMSNLSVNNLFQNTLRERSILIFR